jgi:predicted N-acetyltransferase YhbS
MQKPVSYDQLVPGEEAALLYVHRETLVATYSAALGLPAAEIRSFITVNEEEEERPQQVALIARDEADANLVVARAGKDIVGFGLSFPAENKSGDGVLEALYVDPSYQENGLGSELLKKTLAPYVGKRVCLETVQGTAESFYSKFRFTPTGKKTLDEDALKHGLRFVRVEMVCENYDPEVKS